MKYSLAEVEGLRTSLRNAEQLIRHRDHVIKEADKAQAIYHECYDKLLADSADEIAALTISLASSAKEIERLDDENYELSKEIEYWREDVDENRQEIKELQERVTEQQKMVEDAVRERDRAQATRGWRR